MIHEPLYERPKEAVKDIVDQLPVNYGNVVHEHGSEATMSPRSPSPKKKLNEPITPLKKSQIYDAEQEVVSQEIWFTLKKYNLKAKPQIDCQQLPRNIRKAIDKFNEDNFVQVDFEKAIMLAAAQGNNFPANLPLQINGNQAHLG